MLISLRGQAQPPAKPRTDALGDPLPDGAVARLGTLRFKHVPAANTTIDTALFAPDGNRIVSLAASIGSIRLWNATSGEELPGPWSASNLRYTAVAFSPDGALLAAAINPAFRPNNLANEKGLQDTVVLYDVHGATQVKTLSGPPQLVHALGFADGGKTLVAAGDGIVRWWELATDKAQRSWKPFNEDQAKSGGSGGKTKTFTHCSLSPDARSLAIQVDWRENNKRPFIQRSMEANIDKEAIGFDLVKGEMCWRTAGKGARYEKSHFVFSTDGKRVAIAIGSGKVELRDTVTGKLIAHPLESRLADSKMLGGLALSSDGSVLAVAGKDGSVLLWNTKEAAAPREFAARIAQNGPGATACLHFSGDDKRLLVGVDADLQVYDVVTLREVRPWDGHRGWVDHVVFTSGGKKLLTGSAGRGVSGGDYFGPNGEIYYLVRSGGAGEFPPPEQATWDVATWKRLQLTSVRTPPWPNFGSASPDQSVYVGKAGDDRFGLYDMKSGQLIGRMLPPDKRLTVGVGFFSPRGTRFVRYASDNQGEESEHIYAVPSGKLVCRLPAAASSRNRGAILLMEPGDPGKNLAFSPDERLVAQCARGDGLIRIFDTETGKLRHSLGKKLEFDQGRPFLNDSHDVAFSFDGKFLASWSSLERVIRLWDVASGTELIQFLPDETRANTPGIPARQSRIRLTWSPDGRALAVGDYKVRLWELATLGVRRELPGHRDGPVRALAFAPDSQVLASASSDTTVLIWDTATTDRPISEKAPMNHSILEKHWWALAENDAGRAFAAIIDMVSAPHDSAAWIRERVKPADPLDPQRIEKLIGDLDDKQFKTRQTATAELLQMGDRVVPAIDKALATKPALETHLRLQDLRKRLISPVLKNEPLRVFRALEVLERMGTPEARDVLQMLADGAPGAMVTTQARAALERLRGRSS
jgi:WD40 repeat protein